MVLEVVQLQTQEAVSGLSYLVERRHIASVLLVQLVLMSSAILLILHHQETITQGSYFISFLLLDAIISDLRYVLPLFVTHLH